MITSRNVLYEDDDIIAVFKPAGMFVHRTILSPEKEVLLQKVRDLVDAKLWPVHRLDKPTSGVILFTKTAFAAKLLANDFSQRRVDKQYLAVVRGFVEPFGTIDYPLKDERGRQKEAISEYERFGQIELPIPVGRYPTARYSLILVKPVTGRRHQIRQHLAHIFHPVIGDTTYGEGRHNRLFRKEFGLYQLLLISYRISFTHPRSGEQLTIQSELDPSLLQLFKHFGWSNSIGVA